MKIWTKSKKKIINSYRRSVLGVHWKDWYWCWNSNTLATWCEELTHLKRPWCWERLRAGGEGDDRNWDGWMASPTQWTWVWVGPRSWWWTGRSGVLQFMGSLKSWTRLSDWTELKFSYFTFLGIILTICSMYWLLLLMNPVLVFYMLKLTFNYNSLPLEIRKWLEWLRYPL